MREGSRARRWARHEKRWLAFASDEDSTRAISYDDVPWPPSTKGMLSAVADAEMTDEETEPKETDALRTKKRFVATRRAYRRLVLRWHADKFAARFSARPIMLGGGTRRPAAVATSTARTSWRERIAARPAVSGTANADGLKGV